MSYASYFKHFDLAQVQRHGRAYRSGRREGMQTAKYRLEPGHIAGAFTLIKLDPVVNFVERLEVPGPNACASAKGGSPVGLTIPEAASILV